MTLSLDWDRHYRTWQELESFPYSPAILARLAEPTEADIRWLVHGLKDERKWFVATCFDHAVTIQYLFTRARNERQRRFLADFQRGQAFPEVFFEPLMDAGIDECEPSGCRKFVVACSSVFGVPRSLEYLYDVIESEGMRRKTGAFLALYYARFCPHSPPVGEEQWRSLGERRRELALKSFLFYEDRPLRFAALRELSMHVEDYPDRLRDLALQFIQIAPETSDRTMRSLIQHKLERSPRTFPDTWPDDVTHGRT